MKIKVKKNPRTCEELSEFIGYHVNQWIKHPDGSMEIDIEADSLTPGETKALIDNLEKSQIHLVEGEPEVI